MSDESSDYIRTLGISLAVMSLCLTASTITYCLSYYSHDFIQYWTALVNLAILTCKPSGVKRDSDTEMPRQLYGGVSDPNSFYIMKQTFIG